MRLSVRTKGNSTPRGKRKVFFTSHPDDFDQFLDVICDDIFKTQDCAIYFASDGTPTAASGNSGPAHGSADGNLAEGYLELGEMNLFVIPVTYKLLTKPNRAMEKDFIYAREHRVPILPIMMEKELDEFYAKKFDKLEYLNRLETDVTSIGYENKLAQFLGAVLVSDEMSARIRAAFEAYVFLSYRKKDRKYANELMRLIHRNPLCRDIAIWYDEYLVPGEDFEDTIMEAMRKSDLFTMVVTPNVTEPGNYVLMNEYPEASKLGKMILPVEMVDTDAAKMAELFKDIPECLKGTGDEAFYQKILEMLAANGKTMQKDDPEHNFLVGLAYLDGIDVEKDYQQGLELITLAADAGLLEAMEKLGDVYENGIGCQIDYARSREWLEKAVMRAEELYGSEGDATLEIKAKLAEACSKLCDIEATGQLTTFVYETRKKKLGEEHPETLKALGELAFFYIQAGNYKEALELLEKACESMSRVLGDEHPDTLRAYQNKVNIYLLLSDYDKTVEAATILYEKSRKALGEYHVTTLLARQWIASGRAAFGAYQEALEILEQVYGDVQKYLKDDWKLAEIAAFMGEIYAAEANFEKGISMYQKSYDIYNMLVGPEHPITVFQLFRMGTVYDDMGLFDKAYEIYLKSYDCLKTSFGEKHLDTLMVYSKLAYIIGLKGDLKKAVEMHKKAYDGLVEAVGEEHSEVVVTLCHLSSCHRDLEEYENALETVNKAYELCKKMYGEEGPLTLQTARYVPEVYYGMGQREKAFELGLKGYENVKKAYGEEHFLTYIFHLRLGKYYGGMGDYEKAVEILEKELKRLAEILGPEDMGILCMKLYLVMAYEGKGEHEKAMEMGKSLLEADRRVLGEEHFETLKLKKKLEELQSKA